MSATQNNKVNKLVFNLTVALGTTIGSCRARAFVCTQIDATTVASDIYGRFMQERPAMPVGTVVGAQRGKNDVQAWFTPVPEIDFDLAEGAVCSGQPFQVAIDFINHLAPNAYTAPPIDPTTTRLFKLRAVVTKTAASVTVTNDGAFGRIYCQRQHSIEV